MSVEKVEESDQQRERLYRLVIVALVLVLVATWVAVIWLVQGKSSAEEERDEAEKKVETYAAGPDALADAEQALEAIVSYDYRELDAEFEWTNAFTGELRTRYEDVLVPKFRKLILKLKMTAEGEVVEKAYNVLDDNTVQVIAFVRQSLTNKEDRKGVRDEQWSSLTMVRDGDRWLIEAITPFNVPPPSS